MKTTHVTLITLIALLTTGLTAQDKPANVPSAQPALDVTYLGNEGFLVRSEHKKVLIDALFKSDSPSYLSPSDVMIDQMIKGQPPYDHVDLLLITHRHSDHFKPDLTIAFLENHPACKLIANNQVVDKLRNQPGYEQVRPQIVEITSDTGKHSCKVEKGIEVDVFCLKHTPYMKDGKNIHAEIKNLAFVANLEETRFYHSGDAAIAGNSAALKDYAYSQKPVDIMFLQQYDKSPASKQFITNTIKPDMIIAMHIPPDKMDASIKRFMTHYPYGMIMREQGQTLHFTNTINFHQLSGPCLGQQPPGDNPKVFAPGIISSRNLEHSGPAFSPDGNEVFWSISPQPGPHVIKTTHRENGGWSAPSVASFSGQSFDSGPVFSVDERRIYFMSVRPRPGEPGKAEIWFVEKQGDHWGKPARVGIVERYPELQFAATPTIASSGTLYFQAAIGICRAELVNGEYAKPQVLPRSINLPQSLNWTPFIAPDESYLLFSSDREDRQGGGDLYITHRLTDGSWTDPVRLGEPVNTQQQERFPMVSWDGKVLFFTRPTPDTKHDIYWVDTHAIPALHSLPQRIRKSHIRHNSE